MIVFTVFFGILGRMPSGGLPYPVFFLLGLIPWHMVSKILNQGSTSVVGNATLVTRVYFPRVYLPTSIALASLVDFMLAASVLVLFLLLFRITPQVEAVLVPAFLLVAWITALGAAYWLSAINVLYRDVTQMLPFLSQLWMFSSPIIYPATLVPEPYQPLYYLNPLALVVTGFRWTIGGLPPPPVLAWVLGVSVAVGLLASGYIAFRRLEHRFADVI
jgi:lipopolysaccharide transport system permease protein